jgi:hypothetical protein
MGNKKVQWRLALMGAGRQDEKQRMYLRGADDLVKSTDGARPKRSTALVYIGRAIPVRLGVALGVLMC